MKVTDIRIWKQNLGMTVPYTIAYKTVDSVENVFIEIQLDNKIKGLGASNPSKQVVSEDVEGAFQALSNHDFSWLIGKEFTNIEDLLSIAQTKLFNSPGSLCALEIALFDAYTKKLKIPLVEYWGRQIESLPTSVTLGIMSLAETLEKTQGFINQGFKVIKVKLGSDLESDLEKLESLRKEFGQLVKIRVDANQGYSLNETKQFLNRTTHLQIELVEQPVSVENFNTLTELDPAMRKLVAADESLVNEENATELAENHTCGIFNIKLMKTGGLSEARRIVDVAEKNDIDLMWGCNDESIISISAGLHIAYSSVNTRYIDLDGSLDLSEDVARGGFEIKGGYMHLLDRPGLGVEIN